MGADGINMGTRFMATKEAPIKDGIKQVHPLLNPLEQPLAFVSRIN